MTLPTAHLSPLRRADGSAKYSFAGFTIVGSVNGPIEVQRRDELPEDAFIEVNVRPDSGVGTTRERHLEKILQSTLKGVVLTHALPRTLLQVVLQVIQVPEVFGGIFVGSSLPLLPALLQTAMLALLSASVPLMYTFTAIALSFDENGALAPLDRKSLESAVSIHVFAFSSRGELLLAESEGSFSTELWEKACIRAKELCCENEEAMVVVGEDVPLSQWMKGVLKEKLVEEQAWRA